MFETIPDIIDDAGPYFWSLLLTVVFLFWGIHSYRRVTRIRRVLQTVVGSFDQPLLFYDDRDRLIFHTSGLILFDKESLRKIRRLHHRPPPDRELRGEMDIDNNRYRYRSRLLEYRPGSYGTIVLLEFKNSGSGRK